jgi:hypothetical protein
MTNFVFICKIQSPSITQKQECDLLNSACTLGLHPLKFTIILAMYSISTWFFHRFKRFKCIMD